MGEVGTVTLNSETFPFNNSMVTVSLAKAANDTNYIVIVDIPPQPAMSEKSLLLINLSMVSRSGSLARQNQ